MCPCSQLITFSVTVCIFPKEKLFSTLEKSWLASDPVHWLLSKSSRSLHPLESLVGHISPWGITFHLPLEMSVNVALCTLASVSLLNLSEWGFAFCNTEITEPVFLLEIYYFIYTFS